MAWASPNQRLLHFPSHLVGNCLHCNRISCLGVERRVLMGFPGAWSKARTRFPFGFLPVLRTTACVQSCANLRASVCTRGLERNQLFFVLEIAPARELSLPAVQLLYEKFVPPSRLESSATGTCTACSFTEAQAMFRLRLQCVCLGTPCLAGSRQPEVTTSGGSGD